MHMSVQGIGNGTEQWCPVKGGGCILEVCVCERFYCILIKILHFETYVDMFMYSLSLFYAPLSRPMAPAM